jgi:hypothetical protein
VTELTQSLGFDLADTLTRYLILEPSRSIKLSETWLYDAFAQATAADSVESCVAPSAESAIKTASNTTDDPPASWKSAGRSWLSASESDNAG